MPASNHLFEVNNTVRNIREEDVQTFHTLVVKLLFLSKQVRPDILTGVSFLVIRVRYTDEGYENNLDRVLKYLQITQYLVLTLDSYGSRMTKWWVGADFSVHHKIRSCVDPGFIRIQDDQMVGGRRFFSPPQN